MNIPTSFIASNAIAKLLELFSGKEGWIVDGVFVDRPFSNAITVLGKLQEPRKTHRSSVITAKRKSPITHYLSDEFHIYGIFTKVPSLFLEN